VSRLKRARAVREDGRAFRTPIMAQPPEVRRRTEARARWSGRE